VRLELKLQWVHELPHQVWQGNGPAIAQETPAKYDSAKGAMARTPGAHCGSEHLCGHGAGSLRADAEYHAAGHGISPAWQREILAYQLGIIDGVAQAAPRRDVLHLAKSSHRGIPAWGCASPRLLKQQAGPLDQMDGHEQADACRRLRS